MADSEKTVKLRFLGGNNPVLNVTHVVTEKSGEVHVGEVGEFLHKELDRIRAFVRLEPVEDEQEAEEKPAPTAKPGQVQSKTNEEVK